jgi:hypothetical protein
LFPDIFLNFCLQFLWPQLPVWQSISCSTLAEFLYLDFYILISSHPPFCITFLSDGITTSINKQVQSLFWTIGLMSGLFARTSVPVCIPWFHNTVVSSRSVTDLGMWEYQFSVVLISYSLHIE